VGRQDQDIRLRRKVTVAVSVFNDDGFFSETASLLLFLDSRSKQVTGAITKNTLTSPSPVVTENLQGTSTVTGTIDVLSNEISPLPDT
jgi:hypothetical protein